MKTQTQPRAAGEAAHTPTPWIAVDDGQSTPCVHAEFVPDGAVCNMSSFDPELEGDGNRALARSKANAAFIVTACNQHTRLVAENKALREALAKTRPYVELYAQNNPNAISPADTLKQIDAALALAKDGKE